MLDANDVDQMSHQEVYEHMRSTREVIDELISDYFMLHCAASRLEGDLLPKHVHLTEVMTICGWQTFNEAGQRGGDVRILLRDGSMPTYVARGLLESAKKYLENRMLTCNCDHEEDDDEDGS